MEPKLYNTSEAADVIAKANLLPSGAKPLTKRSVARLCKGGSLPGSYLVQGDWCVPQSAIDEYIAATKGNTTGRPPRKKKTA